MGLPPTPQPHLLRVLITNNFIISYLNSIHMLTSKSVLLEPQNWQNLLMFSDKQYFPINYNFILLGILEILQIMTFVEK